MLTQWLRTPYQVQQFLNLVEEYSIRMGGDEPGGQ